MRRFCLLVLLYLPFTLLGSAQNTPPQQPSEASSPKPADYSEEGFVIEKSSIAYHFENDGTGKREAHARIRVQSEAGVQRWGQLVFPYNSANETLDIAYIRVLKANGSTVTAGPDAIQDLSAPVEREAPVYSDLRQKHVTVPALRPGETLEYNVVNTIKTPLAPGQFWMEYTFSNTSIVLDEQLEVDVPQQRKVTLKTQPGMDPKISNANNRRVYTWTSSHRVREDDDDDKKSKKKKLEDLLKPAVQMTTFASWDDMGRWYGGLEKDRREPTAEIRKKAADLTAGKTTDLDKIEALYDYVATNFRYISLSFGLGRYQPHAAADVLHNEYGDCKDKHTLLASLLDASGYHASSVLINSTRKLDPDVPSPLQFDHVISLVPLGKDEIWMDTTTEVAPFRLLASTLRKKQALVIPAGAAPHLQETPADPPMPNLQTQEVAGKINEFGKLNATVDLAVRGDVELVMRILLRRIPRSDWQRFAKRMTELSGLPGEVSDVKIDDPSDTHQAFHIHYQVAASNFFDYSKKKANLALPVSSVSLPNADEESAHSDGENIQLGSPGQFTYRCKLEFPAKYTSRAPLPFSMKRDYGDYRATYKIEGAVFTAERILNLSMRELPASRAADYLAFRRAVYADLEQQVSVDASAAGDPVRSADLKGDDLNDAAIAALNRRDYQSAADLFNRVLDADPKHKTARANLGKAYMDLREYDKAIDAFQKYASLNPYEEGAYNNLGWAYSTARQYEGAAAAFNKALEINPLSPYTHRALAGMYAEQHKYDQAIPEYEKAASLLPNDALLQINLGDAYLNAGQDDKALAAFDSALSLSATPLTWNNIAYNLALKGTHLDLAQQYAESAVAATVAESRNLRLDQLSDRDLNVMRSLVAYWDTLGWVHFAKGDLDKAEKYIAAAARLDPRSDVADHLGQIYEKRGKKDDAIRAYALALIAPRPDPETRGRLAKLVGGDNNVDSAVREYGHDPFHFETVKLNTPAAAIAKADYFFLFASDGSAQDVKFVNGDDKLKTLADSLRATKYESLLPDDNPGRIVRRGTISCASAAEPNQSPQLARVNGQKASLPPAENAAGCTLTFVGMSDVRSIN